MVGGVTRCVYTLDGPTVSLDDISVSHFDVRRELHIATLFNDDSFFSFATAVRSVTVGRCIGVLAQKPTTGEWSLCVCVTNT